MKLKQLLKIFKPKYPKRLKNRRFYRKIKKTHGRINQLIWMLGDIGKLQKELEKAPLQNSEVKEVSEKLISKLANLINKYNKNL